MFVNLGLLSPWFAQAAWRAGLMVAAGVWLLRHLGPKEQEPAKGSDVAWDFWRVAGLAGLFWWGATTGFLLPGTSVVPVLTYHRVTVPPDRPYPVPTVRPDDFAWQMSWLDSHGYRTVAPETLLAPNRPGLPKKPLLITFDDGWRDNLTAARIMRGHAFTGTIFVVTGDLGRPLMLGTQDLLRLEASGMSIGSHTVSHPHLERLGEVERRTELTTSRERLAGLLGHPVDLFASPYGALDLSPRTLELIRQAGYRLAFASHNFGLNVGGPRPLEVRRLLVPGNPWLARLEFTLLLW